MELTARSIEVFELSDDQGIVGLFQVVAEWEGFKKLQKIGSNDILIAAPKSTSTMESTFSALFGEIFNKTPQLQGMVIVSASVSLILRLNPRGL